jgi:hypothetical protein
MIKTVRFILVFLFVLGLVLMSAPHQAQAIESEISPLIAGGSWTAGQVVDVTTLAAKAPTWLQLLTNGVKVTEAGKICHPFRGGQFGWIGEIRQYKSGEWFRLKTTNDWVPSKEGEFMSCAEAPAAGTYALFGYWIRPFVTVVEEPQVPVTIDCVNIEWDYVSFADSPLKFYGSVSGLPEGTQIDLSIQESYPDGIEFTGSTSTTTDKIGDFSLSTSLSEPPDYLFVKYFVPAYGCSYTSDMFEFDH